jgi:hypothetical protein
MRIRNTTALLTLAAALALSGPARAEPWTVTVAPSLDFAFKQSNFSLNGATTDLFVKPTYTSFVPSLAVSVGPMYAVVSYDTPMAVWQDTSLEVNSDLYKHTTFSRTETVFTLGYRLPWSVNVFAGYLHGRSRQTELWNLTYDADPGPGVNWQHGTWPTTYNFDERGYFVGASYVQVFGNRGTLSISGAYGKMDGNFDVRDYDGTADPALWVSTHSQYLSSSPGYSLSLGWTGPLSGSLVYRAGLKYTRYVFDTETLIQSTGAGTTVGPSTTSITEEIFTFFIGIGNFF